MKSYNFNVRTDLTRAMNLYNKTYPTVRFNTLDGMILNLLRSFAETNTEFYMSNKELGQIMIADPGTVQRSVDRLVSLGLAEKKTRYVGQKPQRILIYKEKVVSELFSEVNTELYTEL